MIMEVVINDDDDAEEEEKGEGLSCQTRIRY